MKYFLIFLMSLIIAAPVYAAKSVKGSIPVVQPLQPAPAGVGPDFSKSIESSGGNSSVGDSGSSAASAPNPRQSQSPGLSENPTNPAVASQPHGPNFLVLLGIIFIGALALGWVWLKRDKS